MTPTLEQYLKDRRAYNHTLCRLRVKAHRLFDFFWTTQESRTEAYEILADALGIDEAACHFNKMNINTLRRVITALQRAKELGWIRLKPRK